MSKEMSKKMLVFYDIKDCIEQYKFEEAKAKLGSFLEYNPGDSFALLEYAKIVMFDGEKGIEVAEQIFEVVINNLIIKEENNNIKDSEKKLKNKAILELIYLNIEKNDYDEAYNNLMLLDKNKDFSFVDNGLRVSILNKRNEINKEELSYLEKQQLEYNSELAFSHIKRYHQSLFIEQDTAKFGENIDINQLMHLVKPFLVKENRMCINDLYDNYLFKSDKIGQFYQNRCRIDFFRVRTIKGTDNIVSMFPLKTPSHVNLEEADNIIDINDIDLAIQKLKRK